jgi:hypothetical protein
MKRSSPLSFVAMVLAGWAAVRTAIIVPPWSAPAADAAAPGYDQAPAVPGETRAPWPPLPALRSGSTRRPDSAGRLPERAVKTLGAPPALVGSLAVAPSTSAPAPAVTPGSAAASPLLPLRFVPAAAAPPARAVPRRWSVSAWSFVRRGEASPLAAGGLLGGSQAGARLIFRIAGEPARPLALSLRAASALRRPAGAEAALGIDWKPSRRLPLHLLAERRQALGEEGRSAFAIAAYGGVSDAPVGRFRIDAYAQAGFVGVRSRDGFGDGSIRVSLPLGRRVRLGAGAWAAAQPGVARLDLGPQAALRLPLAGRNVTVAADWRIRVAGEARPGSGPALTLATDF